MVNGQNQERMAQTPNYSLFVVHSPFCHSLCGIHHSLFAISYLLLAIPIHYLLFYRRFEKLKQRVLDSQFAIQTPKSTTSVNTHASLNPCGRKRHPSPPLNSLHAQANRADLQPAFFTLPNRHFAKGRYNRHHAIAIISAK